jgi:hypothetical protein
MNEARTYQSQLGDGADAPRSSSTDWINNQAEAMLDNEDETEREQFQLSNLPTNLRSRSGEHYNATSQRLLDLQNETRENQHQNSLTTASHSLQPIRHHDMPAESLLTREKPLKTLLGWPSAPKPVQTPFYINVLNGIFDVFLLTCSVAFLAFTLVVSIHD